MQSDGGRRTNARTVRASSTLVARARATEVMAPTSSSPVAHREGAPGRQLVELAEYRSRHRCRWLGRRGDRPAGPSSRTRCRRGRPRSGVRAPRVMSAIAVACSGTVASRIAALITAVRDIFRVAASPSIRRNSTGDALKDTVCTTHSPHRRARDQSSPVPDRTGFGGAPHPRGWGCGDLLAVWVP